jgi:hypothetical protein
VVVDDDVLDEVEWRREVVDDGGGVVRTSTRP